jgi:hypothetical protein
MIMKNRQYRTAANNHLYFMAPVSNDGTISTGITQPVNKTLSLATAPATTPIKPLGPATTTMPKLTITGSSLSPASLSPISMPAGSSSGSSIQNALGNRFAGRPVLTSMPLNSIPLGTPLLVTTPGDANGVLNPAGLAGGGGGSSDSSPAAAAAKKSMNWWLIAGVGALGLSLFMANKE